MKKQNPIRIFGLTQEEINEYQQIALERYGKASVSLLARKLLRDEKNKPKEAAKNLTKYERQRVVLRIPSEQVHYLRTMAQQQHCSLNEMLTDIIQEFITENPVFSNDEVQALYQSNYQLLRIGRNLNQIVRQFNNIMPHSFTTQQLNDLAKFLKCHTDQVGKVLRKQGKSFKYQKIRELTRETTKSQH